MRAHGEEPDGLFVNYCAVPYAPRGTTAGKLRSRDVLEAALGVMGADARHLEVLGALRKRFGADRTIWALKKNGDQLALELYFYNYGRHDPELIPSKVLETLRPWLASSPELARRTDRMRYFLFSLDLDPGIFDAGVVEGLHVYVHDVADRATGISYFVDARSAVLENHYAFYRPATELEELRVKVADTVFVDFDQVPFERVLQPDLLDCRTICAARKQRSDCLYYSGLGLDQFRIFLARYDYPAALREWVDAHRARLDHLEYDVGIDYVASGETLDVRKTSIDGSY